MEVLDFPGHWAAILGSAACQMHPDENHESYLVLSPIGDEHWACRFDLNFVT
ncbi:hypothetical protein [Nonomuraea typhae]|uniref:Uncharacterized protein n=1 Tax=Nonomuraea typhae TaxID=2603600 RepID=A0ABW7YJZ3_9ACTN